MSTGMSSSSVLSRRDAVSRVLRERGDALVVSSLGSPSFDVSAAGDSAANFYLWGAMGGAVMVGLGLAFAQPRRRVIVVAGDGEMMMGLGSLATVAVERPANLSVVVLDNEHYGETGMQPSHSGRGVDLVGVASAVGFASARIVRTAQELEASLPAILRDPGPAFIVIKVTTDPMPTCLPPRDGPWLRSRMRELLLGDDAHR